MKSAQTQENAATPLPGVEQLVDQQQATLPSIAEIAYFKAENRGFAPGYELHDWLEAEHELNLD